MPEPTRQPTAVPVVDAAGTAWLTADQMVEVDRLMIDDIGISLLQMMENAGRSLARLAIDRFDPERVVVLAGSGGNGGGGLAAARHLANAGCDVWICLARQPELLSVAARHQFDAVSRMGLPVIDDVPGDLSVDGGDLVIDAVLGYSLRGAPRGRAGALVEWAAGCPEPVLALDTPSGLDVTTGEAPGSVVGATATLTLALPKTGLRAAGAVGELFVADISVPRLVYEAIGVHPVPSFRSSPILQVDRG